MDDRQFDRLALALNERLTRRGLGRLGALTALLSTLGASWASSHDAEAAKKKKGKKKKPTPKPTCTPNCAGGKTCGSNGCPGGSCGACQNGFVCSDLTNGGVCACPAPRAACGNACCGGNETCLDTACCPNARVCDDACCAANQTCVDDACCPDERACAGVCCTNAETCIDDGCCANANICDGACCGNNETCLDDACCANDRVCNGNACCGANQTCLDDGCCAADRICNGSCCGANQTCIGADCCANDRVCDDACCGNNQTCIGADCCPNTNVCNGVCCAGNETCVDNACCPNASMCAGVCCTGNQTCLDDACCANDRVCNGDACCTGGQTCLSSGCCPADRVCDGICCAGNETCIDNICCANTNVCNGACCTGGQTCIGAACCAEANVCGGDACCGGNETCIANDCCPNSAVCNGDACCIENQTCLASGCCPTARICEGACCGANEECVDGACCAAPCGEICCAGNQTCLGETCCPNARICGSDACCTASEACIDEACCSDDRVCGAACCDGNQQCVAGECCPEPRVCEDVCCVDGETCQGGACAPPPPAEPLTCADCGLCQRCEANGQTERAACAKPCADGCLAQTMCQQARNSPQALRLAQHLISQGYRQVEQPVASVLDEDGSFIAAAVAVPYARPAKPAERATVILSVDADGAEQTHVRRERNRKLQEVDFAVPAEPGAEPEVLTLQASISVDVPSGPDESRVSEATCRFCRSMCGFSMYMLDIRQIWKDVSDVKGMAELPKTVGVVERYWPRLLRDLRTPNLPDALNTADRAEALALLKPFVDLIEVEERVIKEAVNHGFYDPNVDGCAGCAAEGFCCQGDRRACPSESTVAFNGCVDPGGCCENGPEGTCPPGIGSVCFDFREDRFNCGGCAGHGGQDCTSLAADPNTAQCRAGKCEFSGCTDRGQFIIPGSGELTCCRRGDTDQTCPGIGRTCAGASCCVEEHCPGDCPNVTCPSPKLLDPTTCACVCPDTPCPGDTYGGTPVKARNPTTCQCECAPWVNGYTCPWPETTRDPDTCWCTGPGVCGTGVGRQAFCKPNETCCTGASYGAQCCPGPACDCGTADATCCGYNLTICAGRGHPAFPCCGASGSLCGRGGEFAHGCCGGITACKPDPENPFTQWSCA